MWRTGRADCREAPAGAEDICEDISEDCEDCPGRADCREAPAGVEDIYEDISEDCEDCRCRCRLAFCIIFVLGVARCPSAGNSRPSVLPTSRSRNLAIVSGAPGIRKRLDVVGSHSCLWKSWWWILTLLPRTTRTLAGRQLVWTAIDLEIGALVMNGGDITVFSGSPKSN